MSSSLCSKEDYVDKVNSIIRQQYYVKENDSEIDRRIRELATICKNMTPKEKEEYNKVPKVSR